MTASYFHSFRYEKEFLKIINNNEKPTGKGANKNGEPWKVRKVLRKQVSLMLLFRKILIIQKFLY